MTFESGRGRPSEPESDPDRGRAMAGKELQARLVNVRRDVARSGLDSGVVAEAVAAARAMPAKTGSPT